ncbi:hypothetical protein B0H16DRAFT_716684 [Mycena metata]|uniref:Uncharacterized protein n=1 Tax=Mycena metata TaxID=1033252 RepID=A0AAD7J2B9_9AGAR|nr:hypothetical protein B0H16DRAFT_716684 [Mycena metata]
MASLAPAAPVTQSCDYCHQKPKHGTHAYCSKTCAAQIAALCNYCQKKPKYQNFDFCGKNCAALAAAAAPASANRTTKNPPAPAFKTAGRGTTNAAAPQAPGNPLLDPVHLAKLVAQAAQHIPQVQSFLAAVVPAQPAPPPAPVSAPVSVPMPANPQPKPPPRNNPFLNQGKQQPASSSPAPASSGAAVPNPTQAPLQPLDCLVPGCGQPVHVDASGAMSDYCSKKHREEAVSLGLVPPCIMCLMLPQSDTDYFCGRECREEAMSKAMDP